MSGDEDFEILIAVKKTKKSSRKKITRAAGISPTGLLKISLLFHRLDEKKLIMRF